MIVKNLTSNRSGRVVANQFVMIDSYKHYTAFQSYKTLICEFIDQNSLGFDAVLRVSEKWNYSRTTTKYFKQFLFEIGIDSNRVVKALREGRPYIENNGKNIAIVVFENL